MLFRRRFSYRTSAVLAAVLILIWSFVPAPEARAEAAAPSESVTVSDEAGATAEGSGQAGAEAAETVEEEAAAIPWKTAEEAEAARVAAEEKAMAAGEIYNKKLEAAEALEEEAAEAEEAAAELEEALEAARTAAEGKLAKAEADWQAAAEAAEKKAAEAEAARLEADAAYQDLVDAAMALKEATEASVRLSKAEAIDDSKILASFTLGETWTGKFNENLDPVYLRFLLDRDAKVRIHTSGSNVGISILNAEGSTILTLVPSSTGQGSLCSLNQGEYTFLVSAIGTSKNISVTVQEEQQSSLISGETVDSDSDTEMETLIEFDD